MDGVHGPRGGKYLQELRANLLTGEEVIEGVKIAADAAKVAGDETAKAVDELLKERLESHKADRQVFDQFKSALGDLANALSTPTDNVKSTREKADGAEGRGSPLVFVIDELDRCRPSFALELLEKIKHFFAVPGVTFVLPSRRVRAPARESRPEIKEGAQ